MEHAEIRPTSHSQKQCSHFTAVPCVCDTLKMFEWPGIDMSIYFLKLHYSCKELTNLIVHCLDIIV